MYTLGNPINRIDPSGHDSCVVWNGTTCIVGEDGTYYPSGFRPTGYGKEVAPLLIANAGYQPSSACLANAECSDSYNTLVSVVAKLGYAPSEKQILAMTASAEYFDYRNYNGGAVGSVGQEGLARNYYNACSNDGCSGDELYKFMSGFSPWFGGAGATGAEFSDSRADLLLSHGINGEDIRRHTNAIFGEYAIGQSWDIGLDYDKPWQWFTLSINQDKLGSAKIGGYGPGFDAILSVDLGNHQYFWMFTYRQVLNFEASDWR